MQKALYTIAYIVFFLVIILPIVYTFINVFADIKDVSFMAKTSILLFKSISIASSIALLSTLIGTVLSLLLYKTKLKYSNFFKIAILIPLFISPYILAVAWKDFAFLVFNNYNFFNNYFGVIFILTIVYTPLSILIIGSALTNINSELEDAGLMIISLKKMVFKIILPLIKPAITSSFVLVFIFSISEFTVPSFLSVKVFTTEIFTQFSAFYKHSVAIVQSFFLVLICVALLLSEKKYISNAAFLSVGSKGTNSNKYKIKHTQIAFFAVISWLMLSVFVPFITLIMQSFKDGTSTFFKAYNILYPSFGNSLKLSFTSAFIIVMVGIIASWKKNNSLFNWMLLFVFAIPSTIFGISLIKFYNHQSLNFIYSSSAIIIIAYVGKFSFISAKIIGNAIKQIPKSLNEQAQLMGVSFLKRQQKIILPIIIPSLFISFMISFIFCLGELGTSIMLYPPGTEIMPIKVFTIMANSPQSLTSSMTLIVFFISLIIITSFYFILKLLLNPKKNNL